MTNGPRYTRQERLPGVGPEGQARLARGHALVIGCGALGCAAADILARAGVGRLTLVDRDVVELGNLHRQCLFTERDASEGLPKAEAARRRLAEANSTIEIVAHVADLHAGNAERLAADEPRIILDGTDNFETRYLLNDLAVSRGIALAYAGVVASRAVQTTIIPGRTPCLRCLAESPPAPGSTPTCESAGVWPPAVQLIAACQASDALKVLLGREETLDPSILEVDLWTLARARIDLSHARRDDCPCCGARSFDFLTGDAASDTVALCGTDAVQVRPRGAHTIDLPALAERLRAHGHVDSNRFFVRSELSLEPGDDGVPCAITVFPDARAIVRGTTRADRARTLYARYIGV